MKIKRTSWHYKISNFGSVCEKRNDNLCCYFWRLVGKIVLSIGFLALSALLVHAYFSSALLVSNSIMLAFIACSIAAPTFAIRYFRKKVGKSAELPYENIFFGYLKATKRGVCPLIEYTD